VVTAAHLLGARGRVFHGGAATVAATIQSVLAPARTAMFDSWTAPERAAVFAAVRRLSLEVSRWAAGAYTEEFGAAWSAPDQRAEPYRIEGDPTRPYRSRTLAFLAYHLDPDLDVSLRNSELGQAEHLSIGLTDLYHAFAVTGCPVATRLPTALAHLPLVSGLAALRDEVAERIVFERDHTPLYRVAPVPGSPRWVVRARRPPLTENLRRRPGRCPAVEVLPPTTPAHRELIVRFQDRLDELTGGRCPPTVSADGVSAADVSTAAAISITDQLVHRYGLAVTPGGMTR
jgi:hypothetical protein